MNSNAEEENTKDLKKDTNPILKANILSKFCFWWTFDLFRRGFNQTLKEDHLYTIIPSLESDRITEEFKIKWNDELKHKKPSVFRLLKNLYGLKYFILSGLYGLIHIISKVFLPICFGGYIEYFTINQTHIEKPEAYFYALGIILSTILPSVLFHLYAFFCSKLSIKIRVGLSGLIYEKILKTSTQDKSSGTIINIMSNDLRKFETALTFAYVIIVAPTESLLYFFILYREIGFAGIIGILFILLFLPLQSWIAKKSAKYRLETAKRTDSRIKFVNEIIQGIQVIKMYTWEKYFINSMLNLRQNELNVLRKYYQMFGIARCMYLVSKIAIFLSLTIFIVNGGILNARNVFMTSTIFMLMDENIINLLNNALQNFTDAIVSVKRVNNLLLDNNSIETNSNDETTKLLSKNNLNKGEYLLDSNNLEKSVILENVNAQWNSSSDGDALKNITLNINDNTIVAIIGSVGSGKSTLLHALLGEMNIISGKIHINGNLSYAPQESWIIQGTIRDNIVFGEEYEEKRYNEVLKVCALERDLEYLSNRDFTLIGESGISLSGGQKARVNLARAIYKKADIYLLDDPLSAVDAQVSKHIFEKCVVEYLSGKIRILVTHQLQYLDKINQIILIKSGKIEKQGSFNELNEFDDFRTLENEQNEEIEETESLPIQPNEGKPIELKNRKEEQTEGAVKFEVYKSYFNSYGNRCYIVTFFFVTVISTLSIIGLDFFLAEWVSFEERIQKLQHLNETNGNQESFVGRTNWLLIYISLLLLTLILYVARVLGLFKTCLTISFNIYQKMFNAILTTKMYFFNSNSSGTIVNRFSGDMGVMDSLIPITLFFSLKFIVDVPLFIFVAVLMNYWILFPAITLGLLFYGIRKIYIKTSRSVQRIDAITQSPVYSLVNQTLQGLLIIRGFQAESNMVKKFHQYQDNNTSASFLTVATSRSFAFWLELFYVIYTIAVTISFLIFESHFTSGNVGLVLLQCASIVGMVQFSIRQTAELENQMIRVERITQYVKIREEGLFKLTSNNNLENWPTDGNIEFIDYSLKYSINSSNVLRNLNININSKEKIGVVGRTGAGKSSIIQAIYRLAYSVGRIEIDGININKIGLHDLRSKISIIPQDPVLFSGTVRYNLDPSGQCSDFNLWKALEDVKLNDHIKKFPDGVDGEISESGSNFSVGQKQLICLARAILRNNKILIMDEATANVDHETDKLIQETIKWKFVDCTVITIAHRLESVITSDRILVMDNGLAVEFDTVEKLLENPDGYFTSLMNETKIVKKVN